MEKDYNKYIKDLSVYDLADEFNTQTFIVKDDEKFNELLLIDHFENTEYIERLETQLKKQKEINQKAIEFLKREYNTYPSAKEWRSALIKILEDKEV